MNKVALVNAGDYSLDLMRSSVRRLLEEFGGISKFVQPGQRVLLKPNMLAGKPPEAAVTTHPVLVQAVAELVKEAGGTVLVGDSPGIGSFDKVAERTGIREAVQAAGGQMVPFRETRTVPGGSVFKNLQLSNDYLDADLVINLPKLKTHEMMTMTCAVKNLYGAVVGPAKAGLHLTAGRSKSMFASLLLEIAAARNVAFTIVDAVVAMEGNGPNSGIPRKTGWLLAGENMVAIDVVAARLAGIQKEQLPVELEALKRSISGARIEEIDLCGEVLEVPVITPFLMPEGLDIQFGIPGRIGDVIRNHLTPLPSADKTACVLCGICRDACPPGAIEIKENRLTVSSDACIRCWCCRELCPHHAIVIKKAMLLRLLEKLGVV